MAHRRQKAHHRRRPIKPASRRISVTDKKAKTPKKPKSTKPKSAAKAG